MDEGFSFETVLSFLRRNLFLTGVTLTGMLLLGLGFFGMQAFQPQEESVVFESAAAEDAGSASGMTSGESGMALRQAQGKLQEKIMVDVAGAVVKPGVYEVAGDARVQDVLKKAGGLSEKADNQGIARAVNLAAKVADGMKLYFPFKGETHVLGSSSPESGAMQPGSSQTGGLVNLNLATQSELEELPGVGEVTAKKIIAGRPYGTVQAVKDKKVVGTAVYEKIKDLVTVD